MMMHDHICEKGRAGNATLPENLLAVADGVHGEPFLSPTGHGLQAANSAAQRRRAHIVERDIRRPSTSPGPVYWVCLQAQQNTDARHTLRELLKVARRRFGLRCLSLREVRR
jgi:hypothetical protein